MRKKNTSIFTQRNILPFFLECYDIYPSIRHTLCTNALFSKRIKRILTKVMIINFYALLLRIYWFIIYWYMETSSQHIFNLQCLPLKYLLQIKDMCLKFAQNNMGGVEMCEYRRHDTVS